MVDTQYNLFIGNTQNICQGVTKDKTMYKLFKTISGEICLKIKHHRNTFSTGLYSKATILRFSRESLEGDQRLELQKELLKVI